MNMTTFKISNNKDKETKSTLVQRQKIKRNKAAALPNHLNIANNLDLINHDHFKLTADSKKGAPVFEFLNDDKRDPLTKETSKLYGPNSLKCIFGGVNILNNFLDIDETPSALERYFKGVTKLKHKLQTYAEMENIPLIKLFSLNKNIHTKTREASQNTDLNMKIFLEIGKTL